MQRKLTNHLFSLLIILLAWAMPARAEEGVFDPDSPAEPAATYKLSVSATPAAYAATSGNGRYVDGVKVTLNTSSLDSDYVFKHWLLNGEVYTTSRTFTYVMPAKDMEFVAVYEYVIFDPANPGDPGGNYKRIIKLVGEPQEACSFNINSGDRFVQGTTVTLRAITNQGFDFAGWYRDEVLIASTKQFDYLVPECTSTLVARFTFNPESPGDPAATLVEGDVNFDFTVNITDVQYVLGVMAETIIPATGQHSGDINGDGVVNILDVQNALKIMAEDN